MSDTELHTDSAEDQTPEIPSPDWPSPGKILEKRREELGLSQGRVADVMHLTAHYIMALETDQYDKLPGKTFVKGYLRSYSKLLGADVDEVMVCYQQFVAAQEETSVSEANVIRAKKTYDQNLRWMIFAAVIIVVVVGVSWWLAQRGDADATMAETRVREIAELPADPQPEAVTAEIFIANLDDSSTPIEQDTDTRANEPTTVANAQVMVLTENTGEVAGFAGREATPEAIQEITSVQDPAAQDVEEFVEDNSGLPEFTVIEADNSRQVQLESDGEDLLEVHFSGTSWIEVDNGENTRLYHDMLGTGDDLTIKGKAPFSILVGNANVVDMTFNSRAVDVSSRMRTDNTARIILAPETR